MQLELKDVKNMDMSKNTKPFVYVLTQPWCASAFALQSASLSPIHGAHTWRALSAPHSSSTHLQHQILPDTIHIRRLIKHISSCPVPAIFAT